MSYWYNKAIICITLLLCAGCATTQPDGWQTANHAVVAKNAEIAAKAPELAQDRLIACVVYWAAGSDKPTRISAAVQAVREGGALRRARAAGLTGSDADVLLGVVLASVRSPP